MVNAGDLLARWSNDTIKSTIHRVVEESGNNTPGGVGGSEGGGGKMRLVVEADIAREDLSPLVQGHEVDGVPYLQARQDAEPPPLEIRSLIVNGPSSNRVDLIFFSDGCMYEMGASVELCRPRC